MTIWNNPGKSVSRIQNITRIIIGLMLTVAGIAHLTFDRTAFQAQVPDWVPLSKDLIVVLSGIVEIMLGISLAFWVKRRVFWGWITALFFILVFPGNISQFVNHRSAFGLNTDITRGMRLLFQPLIIVWALWSTGAWNARRSCTKDKK